jgi:hypothetical protein
LKAFCAFGGFSRAQNCRGALRVRHFYVPRGSYSQQMVVFRRPQCGVGREDEGYDAIKCTHTRQPVNSVETVAEQLSCHPSDAPSLHLMPWEQRI